MGSGTASSGSYYSNMGGNGAGDGGYGMLLNNYGGGRASGGPTSGGSIYEVAENGRPELYQSGGRTYLLSGSDGHVIPASRGGQAGTSASAGSGHAPVELQVVLRNESGQPMQAKQDGQRMDGNKLVAEFVLQTVASDTAKGGRTAQAMQQRFGLQRRGIPVGG